MVAPFGNCPSAEAVEKALVEAKKENKPFKLITLTHVDTSSGVLTNVKQMSEIVKRVSPETLIAVDGVCSLGKVYSLFLMSWW